jgi:hypothetical protein
MPKTVITKKELNVPTAVIVEVADLLLDNEITNDIIGTDPDNDELIIEVEYEKEQREIIHQIEDIIADFEESDEDEESEDEKEKQFSCIAHGRNAMCCLITMSL